ncbi:hypothetical protein BD413DRAFT_504804 [Trametes elegans]|nr:hypothetical protein BD413DRAFT_504804 [Trametes elegans]
MAQPASSTSPPPVPAPALVPAQTALSVFRDVHLYAFTQRRVLSDGTVRIGYPLPVVAVGSVLNETEHFAKLLASGFAESNPTGDGSAVDDRRFARADEYDYDSDSDLDDFDEESEGQTGGVTGSPSSPSTTTLAHEPMPQLITEEGDSEHKRVHSNGRKVAERHILLPNVAHRTLRACVFYLYTGKVNFLPLISSGVLARRLALLTAGDTAAPPCSPKSMFRLAESYGIIKLQEAAYTAIVERLTPANIVEEGFSRFFARYDRLREHAVAYLSRKFSHSEVQGPLHDALDKVLLGHSPHAGPLLRSLLGLRIVAGPSAPEASFTCDMGTLVAGTQAAERAAQAPQPVVKHDTTSDSEGPSPGRRALTYHRGKGKRK